MLEFIMRWASHSSKLDAGADNACWVWLLRCFPPCNGNKIINYLCSSLLCNILDAVHPKTYKKIIHVNNSQTNAYK